MRLGISDLGSILIVSLLIVSLGAMVMTWGTNQTLSTLHFLGLSIKERYEAVAERFVVEMVDYDVAHFSHTNVTVYIRNTGSIPITITKVLLDHRMTTNAITSTGAANLTLPANRLGWVQVTLGYAITEDDAHAVTIVTSRGNVVTEEWKVR